MPTVFSSSLTIPKLSMSRNRHSRPATIGAIINGYRKMVRNTREELPSDVNRSATRRPSTNSKATTITV